MNTLIKLVRFAVFGLSLSLLLLTGGATALYFYIQPTLPSVETLKDVRMQVPLRVYAADSQLLAEYGEMKRTPLAYKDIPEMMIRAVLAAEDDRFFQHPGVDYHGLLRAAWHLLRTGEKGQGGSTITMQVARNFFLSREKTYTRKFTEILLALKIERELSKEEILELYLNKIYLGHRAYGVAAAAQIYYGKELAQLGLAQMAMIAALPKAPSTTNPVTNPQAALARRNYVLGRMYDLKYISTAEYDQARATATTAALHIQGSDVEAPYLAEMVRAFMTEHYGEEAYTAGYRVYTTLDARFQQAANRALRAALLTYDQRHGYRGPEAHVAVGPTFAAWDQALAGYGSVGGLQPALIIAVEPQSVIAYNTAFGLFLIDWPGLSWARRHIDEDRVGPAPAKAADIVQMGDIVRVQLAEDCTWQLAQIPAVSGALVSLRPQDGAIVALTGGFDFFHSKFNRVTQAERQPGSSFKPFIYSAALEKGFTPATVVNDAPVVFDDTELESAWRPENYSGHFFGPTRLREALTHSRNLVSIRVLRAIGISHTLDYLARLGFPAGKLPRNLSLALGSGSLTPLQLARGYAVLANGGFLVEPYFIERIEDSMGNLLFQAEPPQACNGCPQEPPAAAAPAEDNQLSQSGDTAAPAIAPRVLDPRNAYLITSMMQDVIRHGTGRKALSLGRHDLAGKTGTTNEQRDAWFSGFNPILVTTAWVGFDTPRPLGNLETGGRAALPMWIDFMEEALRGVPDRPLQQPSGIVTARIDPETGEFTSANNPDAMFEFFRSEDVPTQPLQSGSPAHERPHSPESGGLSQQLF